MIVEDFNHSSTKNKQCTNVATGFCDIVIMFGFSAHSAARISKTTTPITTTTTSKTTTTTTELITTPKTKAKISEYVNHNNLPLLCYNPSKFFFLNTE